MNRTLLQIADIQLLSEFPSKDFIQLDRTYHPFLREPNTLERDPDISIHLEVGKVPSTSHLTKISESDLSWSMYKDGETYYLASASSLTMKEPYWTARFDQRCADIKVFINDKYPIELDGKDVTINPVSYPLDQLLMMYHLAQKEGALIHAAGFDLGAQGFLFPGKSGAGKSTITRQLIPHLRDAFFLSDDRIVVRKLNDTFCMFGTPWPGDALIAENASVKLSNILFLHHGPANRIVEIDPSKALALLLPVVSIPWYDEQVMIKILNFCENMVSSIPAYELYFKPDEEIAVFLEGAFPPSEDSRS
jgi:hypothetical protein